MPPISPPASPNSAGYPSSTDGWPPRHREIRGKNRDKRACDRSRRDSPPLTQPALRAPAPHSPKARGSAWYGRLPIAGRKHESLSREAFPLCLRASNDRRKWVVNLPLVLAFCWWVIDLPLFLLFVSLVGG